MHANYGPLYCETLISSTSGFPIEPINTLTSLVPFVLGLVAIYWLYKHRSSDKMLYVIAAGVALTGIGSTLWHGLRTPLFLSLDVFPGLITFLLVVWYWPYLLGGRWWSYGAIIAIFGGVFGATWLFPFFDNQNGPPLALFFVVGLVGFTLAFLTYQKAGLRLALLSLSFLGTAIMAAVVRTIDLSTCDLVSFGTHFMWHIFLGTTGILVVMFMALLSKNSSF